MNDLEKGQRRTGSLAMCKACSYSELYTQSGNSIDEWNMDIADHGKEFTRNEDSQTCLGFKSPASKDARR